MTSPQCDEQKVRPAPSSRAPAPSKQPSAARYLSSHYGSRKGRAHDGGRSFPQREMQHMHDHTHSLHMQEEDQWHVDAEMVRFPLASLRAPALCACVRTRPVYTTGLGVKSRPDVRGL